MRKLFLIFLLFIGATVFAQDRAETLEELLQLVEEARLERNQPQECPYKLYPYELRIKEPRSDFFYTIYLPNEFLTRNYICGNLYDLEGFVDKVQGQYIDEKVVIELHPDADHYSRRLIFEGEKTGTYISEVFGWEPYQKHEGTFSLFIKE